MSEHELPPSVQVGGLEYKVQWDRQGVLDAQNLWGQVRHGRLVIEIDPEVALQQVRTVLLHEICHAIDSVYSIGLEEKELALVAAGLFQVLRQNLPVVLFLLGDGDAAKDKTPATVLRGGAKSEAGGEEDQDGAE